VDDAVLGGLAVLGDQRDLHGVPQGLEGENGRLVASGYDTGYLWSQPGVGAMTAPIVFCIFWIR
jgi:hypothetical protein